jgi:hypothetical protein
LAGLLKCSSGGAKTLNEEPVTEPGFHSRVFYVQKNPMQIYVIVISKVQNAILISKYTIVIKRKYAIVLSKV